LQEHNLIDYSVFLLEVDRQKKLTLKRESGFRSLVYNALTKEYVLKRLNSLEEIPSEKASEKRKSLGKLKKAVFTTIDTLEKERGDARKKKDCFLDLESIDGSMRYKIGVIDFLTEYNNVKMLEN
jgi:hypothetical protein